ncbi:peptidylprolyl isomerase [Streptomyces kaempferi]
MAVRTSQGWLPLSLDRAKAPCTVQSFVHLARHRFYDRTVCHRLTAYPTLKVLQCGDPTGTGEGGPGYEYKDELPVDLPRHRAIRPASVAFTGAVCWRWPTPGRTRTVRSSSSSTATPRCDRTTRCSALSVLLA